MAGEEKTAISSFSGKFPGMEVFRLYDTVILLDHFYRETR